MKSFLREQKKQAIAKIKEQEKQARKLLSAFRWGEQFFILNKEPLEAYKAAKSSSELVDIQFEFFDIDIPNE